MNTSKEMPVYKCHKKVWDLKIAGIVGDQHGGIHISPANLALILDRIAYWVAQSKMRNVTIDKQLPLAA